MTGVTGYSYFNLLPFRDLLFCCCCLASMLVSIFNGELHVSLLIPLSWEGKHERCIFLETKRLKCPKLLLNDTTQRFLTTS